MMTHNIYPIGRRDLLGLAVAALAVAAPRYPASARTTDDASAIAPVQQLDDALLAAMKAGDHTPFAERYHALAPAIEQVFNLEAVLAASIGMSWATLTAAQQAVLVTAFRRYTVSSYVANFNSFNGQSFQVLPATRAVGNGELVVQSRLLRTDGSPIALDYVMRQFPAGWQVVDVLTDGSISRVAVQRSDFRGLLVGGGVPALAAGLEHKVASLSGGMIG
jgi:phospholipid transport system substrate-binding protein